MVLFYFFCRSLYVVRRHHVTVDGTDDLGRYLVPGPSVYENPAGGGIARRIKAYRNILSSICVVFKIITYICVHNPDTTQIFAMNKRLYTIFLISVFLLLPGFSTAALA